MTVGCNAQTVFERFTERARQVVVFAQEEARTLKHNHIGTEHLLLGLVREREGVAARVLVSLGIEIDSVRAQVVEILGSGEEILKGQIPFTAEAKKLLELALREAQGLGHNYIGTEHLLLALVSDRDSVGARILLDFDIDSQKVRSDVLRMLSAAPSRRPSAQPRTVLDSSSIHVDFATPVRELLMLAASRSLGEKRGQLELDDLLVALTRHSYSAPMLAELGVDETAIKNAIDRHKPN